MYYAYCKEGQQVVKPPLATYQDQPQQAWRTSRHEAPVPLSPDTARSATPAKVPTVPGLAFGVQGLAPYWFELDATGYIGEGGRIALNLETEYELLLTQKWILQPRNEADFHGNEDRELGIGSGLSGIAAGIRLRYEIRREFAPYLSVEWSETFGDTKDLARAAGEDTSEIRLVAGVRFWF